MSHLGKKLDEYISKKFHKVKILRNEKRLGLIGCRNLGAKFALGEILVFLDSHCEVTNFWLQPLIQQIITNPKSLAIPQLAYIEDTTFKFYYNTRTNKYGGGFTWSLTFNSILLSEQHLEYVNYKTPIMVGGNYAINRTFFFQMGTYDEGMENYGGEDIEMSLRIWMCGGKLIMIPCSIIGHVYKSKSLKNEKLYNEMRTRNLIRTAYIWLDEYNELFKKVSGYSIYNTTKDHHVL
ncbi:unnamed protein product [Dimorphilus gyrociliatus]|uniref:Glycosyltransferase 2-like domain-containing protein n=1 Tax=Dimorphilus gyrociliatus TaxID=2664684 RepID=A0A7I8W0P1_9ANNE|nr:unnamed protein product [Dimorphilus gyrociliatus]